MRARAHTADATDTDAADAAPSTGDPGHPGAVSLPAIRRRGARRELLVLGALAATIVAAVGLALTLGNESPPWQVLATLVGLDDEGAFTLFRLRVPRMLLAIVVGVAFGISGALLQSIARNPLASPDILGISGGASVGAVTALLVFGASGAAVAGSAMLGAGLAAVAIVLLAWRRGITGFRFVLVGIALAFLSRAIVDFVLARARVQEAQSALTWIVGSLGGARYDDVALVAVVLVLLLPALVALARPLGVLHLGDDAARGLGVPADRIRLVAVGVAVALAAVATSVAGPVAFVAFVAAPIARRLVGGGRLALAASAATGAALVLLADVVAQRLLPDALQVPVGIVTAAVGAPYLLVLLALGNRSGKGIR